MLGNEVSSHSDRFLHFASYTVLTESMYSLAYAELNFVLGVLFRPEGPAMDLFETDESDVVQAHDFLIPLPKLDTKGVRVIVY